jgi:hypothetical protein
MGPDIIVEAAEFDELHVIRLKKMPSCGNTRA